MEPVLTLGRKMKRPLQQPASPGVTGCSEGYPLDADPWEGQGSQLGTRETELSSRSPHSPSWPYRPLRSQNVPFKASRFELKWPHLCTSFPSTSVIVIWVRQLSAAEQSLKGLRAADLCGQHWKPLDRALHLRRAAQHVATRTAACLAEQALAPRYLCVILRYPLGTTNQTICSLLNHLLVATLGTFFFSLNL